MGDSAHNVQRGHTACLLIIYVMCSRYFAEVSQFEFQSIFLSCKTCIHIGTVAGAGRLRTQWLRRPVHTAILSSPWCNPCDHHLCPGISKLSLFAYNPSSSPSLALFGPNIEPLRLSGTCPHLRGRNVKYVFSGYLCIQTLTIEINSIATSLFSNICFGICSHVLNQQDNF